MCLSAVCVCVNSVSRSLFRYDVFAYACGTHDV
jgi:hypothetical protein